MHRRVPPRQKAIGPLQPDRGDCAFMPPFSRQDLEQLFDRWMTVRDAQLSRLLQDPEATNDVRASAGRRAPDAGRAAMRRLSSNGKK